MFTLRDYINSVVGLVLEAETTEEKEQIIKSWLELIEKHHRGLEKEKLIQLIDEEMGKNQHGIDITIASNEDQKRIAGIDEIKNKIVEWKVNPREIGGARIIMNNIMIDNTVRTQLDNLKRKMAGEY